MGSPADEPGRRPDEAQVSVTLSRGFWMAKFETTQSQWARVVGAFPDRPPTGEFGIGDDLPVYWVSFIEAEWFAARLTERARQDGSLPAGWAVRLPTEAQWEYACRAGTTSANAFGPTLDVADANFAPDAAESGRERRVVGRAVRVGTRRMNAWGLADMHGNIFEWCRDWYHARLPGGTDPDLSNVPGEQNRDGTYSRCRRGGAWNDPATFCRSAMRLRYEPERRSDHIGFRVAIVEAPSAPVRVMLLSG
jgi:formylglycine-generating enzyme